MIIIDPVWEVVYCYGVPNRRISEDRWWDEEVQSLIISDEYEAEELAETLANKILVRNGEVGTVETAVEDDEATFTPKSSDGDYDEWYLVRKTRLELFSSAVEYLQTKDV